MSTRWQDLQRSARAAWQQRLPRERRLLALGAVVLLLAAVWSALLAPAWRVWREAPARQAALQAQTQQMFQLLAEAGTLPPPRRIDRAEALQLLGSSASALLGDGVQLSPQGQELRVVLKAAPAAGLAQWLAQAREKAQARPRQVQLQRQEPAPETTLRPGQTAAAVTWSGTLVLQLP